MLVLGIDPGIAATGWGIIDGKTHRLTAVAYGTIKTGTELTLEKRILRITKEISDCITTYRPDALSIEDIFFLRNVSSAIPVAKVIGALLQLSCLHEISFACYTPLQIKLALTGMGKASKAQVEQMVAFILGIKQGKALNHASDALASAVCHVHTCRGLGGLLQQ